MTIEIFLLNFLGVKVHGNMALSAYIFEKSRNGPILRPQIRAKETFSC